MFLHTRQSPWTSKGPASPEWFLLTYLASSVWVERHNLTRLYMFTNVNLKGQYSTICPLVQVLCKVHSIYLYVFSWYKMFWVFHIGRSEMCLCVVDGNCRHGVRHQRNYLQNEQSLHAESQCNHPVHSRWPIRRLLRGWCDGGGPLVCPVLTLVSL